jgi:hypothetical protein
VFDWVTTSALATAGGTLILSIATFASVRSANRTARAAEQSLLVGLRPVLMQSRLQDPPEKVGFMDSHWVQVPAAHCTAEVTAEAIYLAITLRNVGSGLAVLHGWRFYPERLLSTTTHSALGDFRRLTRDLYVPAGDRGFWQGAFRDPAAPEFLEARTVISERGIFTIDLLYGDHEGGQRVITRFSMTPRDDGTWLAAVSKHWNIDRRDPR